MQLKAEWRRGSVAGPADFGRGVLTGRFIGVAQPLDELVVIVVRKDADAVGHHLVPALGRPEPPGRRDAGAFEADIEMVDDRLDDGELSAIAAEADMSPARHDRDFAAEGSHLRDESIFQLGQAMRAIADVGDTVAAR